MGLASEEEKRDLDALKLQYKIAQRMLTNPPSDANIDAYLSKFNTVSAFLADVKAQHDGGNQFVPNSVMTAVNKAAWDPTTGVLRTVKDVLDVDNDGNKNEQIAATSFNDYLSKKVASDPQSTVNQTAVAGVSLNPNDYTVEVSGNVATLKDKNNAVKATLTINDNNSYNSTFDQGFLPILSDDHTLITFNLNGRTLKTAPIAGGFTPDPSGSPIVVVPGVPANLVTSGQGTASSTTQQGAGGNNTAAAPAHMFTLIKGSQEPEVFVLNNRGERFQVSETLMHEMQQGGSWYEPEIRDQAAVNGMALRFTVDSTDNLGTINNATVGNNMMLIKGNGATDVPDSQLVGNGNAIFAVNDQGERYHVTGDAFNKLIESNGGATPPIANITQAAVDSTAIEGTLNVTPSGSLVTTDPLMDQALASTASVLGDDKPATPATPAIPAVPSSGDGPATPAIPATPAAPAAPETPADESLAVTQSTQSTGAFNFVRGDDGSIFAVNAGNQKFHISPELWGKLGADQQQFKQMSTSDINNQFQDGSTVALTDLNQLRAININAGSEFRLVKGSAGHLDDPNQLTGNGAAVYALTANGDKYHVTAELAQKMGGAFNNIETLNQDELDNKFSAGAWKGDLKTVKDLNSAVKNTSAAGGFAGDTSAIPGGLPAMPGYAAPK